MTVAMLLEAKHKFFGPNDSPSRERRNVLRRMAFSNAFLPRSTKTNLAIVINKNHSTVIHYNKGHDWHYKNYPEYTDLYNAAKEIFSKYDTPITDSEYAKMDNAALLNQLISLKNKNYSQNLIIENQEKELNDLRRYYKNAEKHKNSFPTI